MIDPWSVSASPSVALDEFWSRQARGRCEGRRAPTTAVAAQLPQLQSSLDWDSWLPTSFHALYNFG